VGGGGEEKSTGKRVKQLENRGGTHLKKKEREGPIAWQRGNILLGRGRPRKGVMLQLLERKGKGKEGRGIQLAQNSCGTEQGGGVNCLPMGGKKKKDHVIGF